MGCEMDPIWIGLQVPWSMIRIRVRASLNSPTSPSGNFRLGLTSSFSNVVNIKYWQKYDMVWGCFSGVGFSPFIPEKGTLNASACHFG